MKKHTFQSVLVGLFAGLLLFSPCAWMSIPISSPDVADIVFARVGEVELGLDAYLPEASTPVPAVILIHGGCWQSGDKQSHARLANRMMLWGYAAFAINYRLAPDFPFPAAVEDVQCAVAWVREHAAEYSVDPDRIALLGTSAGGHLAALSGLASARTAPPAPWQPACVNEATSLQVQAVVSCFGPVDLAYHAQESEGARRIVATFLGRPCEAAGGLCHKASPVAYVTAEAPPTLLVHGTDDVAVSCENSERLAAALEQAGADVTYLPVEGAEHSFVLRFGTPEAEIALAAIEAFLAEVF